MIAPKGYEYVGAPDLTDGYVLVKKVVGKPRRKKAQSMTERRLRERVVRLITCRRCKRLFRGLEQTVCKACAALRRKGKT